MRELVAYNSRESCGKCTPCRVGGNWAVRTVAKILAGEGSRLDLQILDKIQAGLQDGRCLCGLGDSAGWVIDSLDALAFVVESGAATIMHGPHREDAPHVADFFVVRVTAEDLAKRVVAARRVRSIVEQLGARPRMKLAATNAIDGPIHHRIFMSPPG